MTKNCAVLMILELILGPCLFKIHDLGSKLQFQSTKYNVFEPFIYMSKKAYKHVIFEELNLHFELRKISRGFPEKEIYYEKHIS